MKGRPEGRPDSFEERTCSLVSHARHVKVGMEDRDVFDGTVRGHFFEFGRVISATLNTQSSLLLGELHDVGVGVLKEHDGIEVDRVAAGGGGDEGQQALGLGPCEDRRLHIVVVGDDVGDSIT